MNTIKPICSTSIKRNAHLKLNKDLDVEDLHFKAQQICRVLKGSKTAPMIEMSLDGELYEVTLDMSDVLHHFSLAQTVTSDIHTNWSSQLIDSDYHGENVFSLCIKFQGKFVGIIGRELDHSELSCSCTGKAWEQWVQDTLNRCRNLGATLYNAQPFTESDALEIITEFFRSPDRNYMSFDDHLAAELGVRKIAYGAVA